MSNQFNYETEDENIITVIREICGDVDDIGYSITVDGKTVRNFLEGDNPMELPEIIISPFVSKTLMLETYDYCTEYKERIDIFNYHSRFRISVYSKNLPELLKVKNIIHDRLRDFTEDVEIFVFQDNDGWQPFNSAVYVKTNYDTDRKIAKIKDPLDFLLKKESIEEVTDTAGSWFLDDTGLYVNPLIDLESLEIYEVLNGRIFSDGSTASERGIQGISLLSESKMGDEDPSVHRWGFDLMVSHNKYKRRNAGKIITGVDFNVKIN